MIEIRLNLKEFAEVLVKNSGYSAPTIANMIGLSKKTFYNWLNGKTTRVDIEFFEQNSQLIREKLKVDIARATNSEIYIRHIEAEEADIGIDNGGGSTDVNMSYKQKESSNVIPVHGFFYKVIMSINAGDPTEIYREENFTGETVFFTYEKSDRCFAVKVVGDSMESNNYRSVSEGEFVVVDMDAEILNGDIVVVHLVNGRQMIKQYVAGQEDSIVLHSFNPEHPDITVKESDVQAMMRVVGKALLKRF